MQKIQFSENEKNNFIKNNKKENNKTKIIIPIIIIALLFIMPIPCFLSVLVLKETTNIIFLFMFLSGFICIFGIFILMGILMITKNKTKEKKFQNNQYVAYSVVCIEKKIEYNYGDMAHSKRSYYIYTKINNEIKRFSKTKEDFDKINIGDEFVIIFYNNDTIPHSYLWEEFR